MLTIVDYFDGGLRAWPTLRREEAELLAQIRQVLGVSRFEEMFAAGSRLTLREAVAAVRDRRGAGTTAPEPWPRPRLSERRPRTSPPSVESAPQPSGAFAVRLEAHCSPRTISS
jgi:hypothetical protein